MCSSVLKCELHIQRLTSSILWQEQNCGYVTWCCSETFPVFSLRSFGFCDTVFWFAELNISQAVETALRITAESMPFWLHSSFLYCVLTHELCQHPLAPQDQLHLGEGELSVMPTGLIGPCPHGAHVIAYSAGDCLYPGPVVSRTTWGVSWECLWIIWY